MGWSMTYIGLGILVILAVSALVVGLKIRNTVREVSKTVFGTEDLLEGIKAAEEESAHTPKSLNAMTSLCLPRIKKDFPEFQYDEMRVRAKNVLTSFLMAVSEGNPSRLSEGTPELREKVSMRLEQLNQEGMKENFRSVKIHAAEISDYRKMNGRCIITFQISCQYYYTKKDLNSNIVKGSDDVLKQSRYNVDVIYIQDRDKITNEHDFAIGTNCPNCGAPLKGVGAKICEYCGTPLREVNIYAWTFSDVSENI